MDLTTAGAGGSWVGIPMSIEYVERLGLRGIALGRIATVVYAKSPRDNARRAGKHPAHALHLRGR